jgi:hypothetical protein
MVTGSRQFKPDDTEGQDSDASSSVSDIFSDCASDSDSNSDLEFDSEDSDDEDDGPEDSYNDDGQLPPEYYLEQAENLDVSQLRQKRYSDSTQEKLDETRIYWNRLATILTPSLCRWLTGIPSADIASTSALTQRSSGKRFQTQMRRSVSCMLFLSGGAISVVAKMADIARVFDTKARSNRSGSGGILFSNKKPRLG